MCSQGSPCRVLLIEDDEFLIRLLNAKNEAGQIIGYSLEIVIAKTLDEGIAAIFHAQNPYDVISLDLKLPGSEGIDTFDAIHAVANDTPIFVYTGHVEETLKNIIISHGAEQLILKGEWSLDQYLTLLHYGAGQYRARAREKAERRFYKSESERLAEQLSAIRKRIPQSKAGKELEEIINNMKLAVAS